MRKTFRLKKEFDELRRNPEQSKTRIAIFYEEYNRQMEIIDKKIEESKKLMHFDCMEHIIEYKKDLNEAKNKIDNFVLNMNDNPESEMPKGLKQKLMKTRIGQFMLLLKEINSLNHKYRKENCDIDNFEV